MDARGGDSKQLAIGEYIMDELVLGSGWGRTDVHPTITWDMYTTKN